MKQFVRTYRFGIICALLTGVILVLPQFILPYVAGSAYKGVPLLMLDDEDIYRARINDVLDGHLSIASPYLYEYKADSKVVVPPINEWIYALPAFIFGLTWVIIASKFLFPAVLFFLVYLLLRKLLVDEDGEATELAALSGAFLVVLGIDFVDYQHLINIAQGNIGMKAMLWERIVNPISGAIQLFGFLVLIYVSLTGRKRVAIASGALLAVMVGYFFSFALAYCVLGSLLVVYLLRRDNPRVKQLLIVLGVSIVLDIPYWWSMLHNVGGAEGKLLASRNGMYFSHEPVINKMLLASTVVFFTLYLFSHYFKVDKKANIHKWIFAGALLLGSWISFNQQILTGREIWYHHFVQYVIPLSYVALVVALFYSVRPVLPRLWRFAAASLIVVSLAYGVFTSWGGALPYKAEFVRQQAFSPVFQYLTAQAKPDCVVLVLAQTETLEKAIPAYTKCDVYSTSYVFIGIPEERILHNFFLHMRLMGVTKDNVEEYLVAHEAEVRHVSFVDWRQLFGRGNDEWYLKQINILKEKYIDFANGNLKEQLQSYRMDYLISDRPLEASLLPHLPGLTLTSETGVYYIYAFPNL